MTYNEKKFLYENIMKDVAKIVKHKLNESYYNRNIRLSANEIVQKVIFRSNYSKVNILIDVNSSIDSSDEMLIFAAKESINALKRNQQLKEVEIYPFIDNIIKDGKVTITSEDNQNTVSEKLKNIKSYYNSDNNHTDISSSIDTIYEDEQLFIVLTDRYSEDMQYSDYNVFFVIFKKNPIEFLESEEFYELLYSGVRHQNVAIKICNSYKTY